MSPSLRGHCSTYSSSDNATKAAWRSEVLCAEFAGTNNTDSRYRHSAPPDALQPARACAICGNTCTTPASTWSRPRTPRRPAGPGRRGYAPGPVILTEPDLEDVDGWDCRTNGRENFNCSRRLAVKLTRHTADQGRGFSAALWLVSKALVGGTVSCRSSNNHGKLSNLATNSPPAP
jgi:hypothetical protein